MVPLFIPDEDGHVRGGQHCEDADEHYRQAEVERVVWDSAHGGHAGRVWGSGGLEQCQRTAAHAGMGHAKRVPTFSAAACCCCAATASGVLMAEVGFEVWIL